MLPDQTFLPSRFCKFCHPKSCPDRTPSRRPTSSVFLSSFHNIFCHLRFFRQRFLIPDTLENQPEFKYQRCFWEKTFKNLASCICNDHQSLFFQHTTWSSIGSPIPNHSSNVNNHWRTQVKCTDVCPSYTVCIVWRGNDVKHIQCLHKIQEKTNI